MRISGSWSGSGRSPAVAPLGASTGPMKASGGAAELSGGSDGPVGSASGLGAPAASASVAVPFDF